MKILFVCTGNTCRSPMAEYLFRKEMHDRSIECVCRSAGIATYTGSPASDDAIRVMKEIGIDMSDFRSTSIKAILADEYDLYVPMTYNHATALREYGIGKSRIYLFHHDIADPYGGGINFYRHTREQLIEEIHTLADFVQKMIKSDEGTDNNE